MPPAASRIIGVILREVINPFLGFLSALAVVIFLWGIVEFILGADSEQKREAGKKHLAWGLIGLVIMFGVWGIIAVIQNFIGRFNP